MARKMSKKMAAKTNASTKKKTIATVFRDQIAERILLPALAKLNNEHEPETLEELFDLFRSEYGLGTSDVELLSCFPEDMVPTTRVSIPGQTTLPPQQPGVDVSSLFDTEEEDEEEIPPLEPQIQEGAAFRGGPPSSTGLPGGPVLPGGPGSNVFTPAPRDFTG